MSFSVRLPADSIAVEAGATTPVSVEIHNSGAESDQYELALEGIDGEWTAVPVPVVNLEAGETQTEKVFFKPPRTNESVAGNYPFVVRVRSLTSGEAKTAQGILAVKAYHHISLEIDPKKGSFSTLSKHNHFQLSLANFGNTNHTVQLFGNDPEDRCAFEFEQEQIALSPGQQKTVQVVVTPRKRQVFSTGQLYGFSVTARSLDVSSIMASTQAQLEQRPVIGIGTIVFGVILAAVVGLWVILIPKPPLLSLQVDQTSVVKGQPVTITWGASENSDHVHIDVMGATLYDGNQRQGSKTYIPQSTGTLSISGYAAAQGRKSEVADDEVTVANPPVVADPVIDSFSIDPKKVALNQPFTLKYKVENATKVILLPLQKELDPTLDEIQLTANSLTTNSYTLVAYNAAGKMDRKTVKVSIFQASKAKIIAFDVDPKKLDVMGGTVNVSWQVNDQAARTEIKIGDADPVPVQPTGNQMISVTKTTPVTIIAIDNDGIAVSQELTVIVAVPPPINPGDTSGPSDATTTGTTPPTAGGTGTASGTNPPGQ